MRVAPSAIMPMSVATQPHEALGQGQGVGQQVVRVQGAPHAARIP